MQRYCLLIHCNTSAFVLIGFLNFLFPYSLDFLFICFLSTILNYELQTNISFTVFTVWNFC